MDKLSLASPLVALEMDNKNKMEHDVPKASVSSSLTSPYAL